ncbi:MAG: tyrosine-type recombinase/integrase [Georgenia sp.]
MLDRLFRPWCADAPRRSSVGSEVFWVGRAALGFFDEWGCDVKELERAIVSRDVTSLEVSLVGRVAEVGDPARVVLLDAAGEPVGEVSDFFASMLASGASPGSLRSYAMDLLRWWRFLAAIEVLWQRAGRVEARDFVLWMRLVGPPGRSVTYAPATINHALAVIKMFYADRQVAGDGPLVNPVPDAEHRQGRRVQAHHNPMQPFVPGRRAPLRQKLPERVPRYLSDVRFDDLFAAMVCDRDRALLAFYVSTGARASELLGVTVDMVDPGAQRIGVRRKGSGRLQWLPASADAFVWLRLYEQQVRRPAGEKALWLTRRMPVRALTYPAARRMLQRANDSLGTGWTLHDLRHTAAQRMVDDPGLSLSDVQWVLGHENITTTQLYLRPREADVVARVLGHHRDRAEPPVRSAAPVDGSGYSAEVLALLLGGQARD